MKPPVSSPQLRFSEFFRGGLDFCAWQLGARNEHAAAKHKISLPQERVAKLGQGRNGINGKAPRSGRGPVYAGFDLDPAERSALGGNRLPSADDKKTRAQIYAAFKRANLLLKLLFWNVSRPKREGLADLQFKLLSVSSWVRTEHDDLYK
jgi:hypothetical protein